MPDALKLTGSAVSIFVVLMSERQILSTSEIAALLGLKKLDSTALGLIKAPGLLSVSKKGSENAYQLSDEGWRRCVEVLTTPTKRTGSAANALAVVLNGLQRGLADRDVAPKDFFVPSDDESPEPASDLVSLGEIQNQIRKTYTKLSRHPGDWVPLADLRIDLGHLDREEVDAALESLATNPNVYLIPWDNRKALRQRDHDAAFRFGGDDNHALRIETT